MRIPITALPLRLTSTIPGRICRRTSGRASGPHQTASRPFTPPDPATLPKPQSRRRARTKTSRAGRRILATAVVIGAATGIGYGVDRYYNSLGLTRALRVFRVGFLVGLDYYINFREDPPLVSSVRELHRRNAERVLTLLSTNGGLYLKMGQAIAIQSALLPPEFQKMFSRMFDGAPQNPWDDVESVIREDFGRPVEQVFGLSSDRQPGQPTDGAAFEKMARASASVAQVHWARLADGREVAVKVQKREIKKQISWDLWAFEMITRAYSYWFDMPMYTLVPFINARLIEETDFLLEAQNSEDMRALVEADSRLAGRVYIPKVYPELSTERVMTTEWIEGVPLWDRNTITAPWHGGYGRGTPGADCPLDDAAMDDRNTPLSDQQLASGLIKPTRDGWKGYSRLGGLGLSTGAVMHSIVDLFSAQLFLWGHVHCDPHPGNMLIRRLPSGQAQVVLLDHGLTVRMSDKFRRQYSRFWKAMVQFDFEDLKAIGREWGLESAEILASASLQKPFESPNSPTAIHHLVLAGKTDAEISFEVERRMRDTTRKMLAEDADWPRDLIFLARSIRVVQANNQMMGSPVNRIKIMGLWASRSMVEVGPVGICGWVRNGIAHLLFRLMLVASDVAWWIARFRQVVGWGDGMEDDLEKVMGRRIQEFGFELNHSIWEG